MQINPNQKGDCRSIRTKEGATVDGSGVLVTGERAETNPEATLRRVRCLAAAAAAAIAIASFARVFCFAFVEW